ncbi:MAG: redoxin family protein [Acidobacteriota bacterium]
MEKQRSTRYRWLVYGAMAGLCVLVVLLAKENERLKDLLQSIIQDQVAAGDHLPGFAATGLAGDETWLSFDDEHRESIVLVFTTTCPSCEENVRNWQKLYQRAGDRYRFAAIGIDDPDVVRAYAEKTAMPFRVFTPTQWRIFPKSHRIAAVPLTLVVARDGRIKEAQVGILDDDFIRRLLAVELPAPAPFLSGALPAATARD